MLKMLIGLLRATAIQFYKESFGFVKRNCCGVPEIFGNISGFLSFFGIDLDFQAFLAEVCKAFYVISPDRKRTMCSEAVTGSPSLLPCP